MIRERILLAPNCNNAEMLRTLASYNVPCFGLRILSGTELAELALTRCGKSIPGTYISSRERAVIIYGVMRKTDYFSNATYQDAEKVSSALNTLRGLIVKDEAETIAAQLPRGPFEEKNKALMQIYQGYTHVLKEKELYDGIDMLRFALANAKPFSGEFLTVTEYPMTPLERALIEYVSEGSCQEGSVATLFHAEQPEQPVTAGITRGYGKTNEIEHIFATMQKEEMPYDTCTIAVTSATEYATQIFAFAVRHNVAVTYTF